ncbi:EF-hand domain-containing protein [Kitasatospora sp. NPDC096077]|uniref:EF-hand domain-containing protein n=1 Tax=Kitasatospora sp. NPDC096077 TaxID=3155544 RepID=UPI00331800B0
MSESQDPESVESSPEVTRRSVLRGTAGLTVGAVAFLASGAEATAAPGPADPAGRLAAAAKVAADQDPLLRRKQLRAFELLDVDGDGFVTKADTVSLARRFAALTEGGADSPTTGQLLAAIDRMWDALVTEPKWVLDTGRLSSEDFVIVTANSVAVTPDRTLQYIAMITNLTFTMADADRDGVIQREDSIRIGMGAAGETRGEAEAGWRALATADPERATYGEVLLTVTDYVTGVDPASPHNLALGRL